MGKFLYQARTADGGKIKGVVEADNQKEALVKLGKSGYTIINIRKEGLNNRWQLLEQLTGGVKSDEMLVFYVQLYDMISAGINLLTALESIGKEAASKNLQSAIQDVAERVKKGSSFADALEKHGNIFSALFISMVRSGESSGKLETALENYSILHEEQMDLKQKVLGALFYPAILLVMGLGLVFFLVIFIIPKFVEIFSEAGVPLPVPTKLLYLAGAGILHYWYLIIIIVAAMVLWFRRYLKTKKGTLWFDTLMLRLPILGPLNYKVALSRFSSTLGILLRSGVPILQSMEFTRAVVQNSIISGAIAEAAAAVEKGEALTDALRKTGRFPANMLQLTAAGEETGNLDGMLEKARIFYNKAATASIKRLTIVIEPLFLIVMGLMVGFIMASILFPLFKMVNLMKI